MTERQLQDAVTQCARLFGYRVYHTFDSRRSVPGFPDLVLLRTRAGAAPRLLFVELKTATGRVSSSQQEWLDGLGRVADCLAALGRPALISTYLWRPEHWHNGEIEAVLRG